MSSGLDVASFDKFNDAYAQFLWTPHKGPGDRSYNYDSCRDLLALNAKWSPGTKTPERKIEPFPSDAVSLKLAFQVVKAPKNTMPGCSYAVCDGMTILPVWKGDLLSGPSNTQNSAKPKITEWNFCILVDPTDVNVGKHRDDVPCYGNRVNRVPVISLKAFYHFKADKETAVKIGAEENDFVVLVAMHISTREIDNWTWQTFWWSNGVHSYGQPPDYKRRSNNRPRSAA